MHYKYDALFLQQDREKNSTGGNIFGVRIILLCFTFHLGWGSWAQDFDRYSTILPQGPVPSDFTEQSTAKVANEITMISEKKARVRKAKKKFVLESTFGVDDFLSSGAVLFNDDISIYLNSVLAELLKADPALQKKIRVYAVKSPVVNAFTTNNGIIFVNLGLLSRLETEAQLAFVLSHEIIHFKKEHVLNAYITNVDIDRAKGDYKKFSVNERGFAKSSYAKELESEADLLGADIYTRSSYALDSVDGVFDILKMADYPVSWKVFHKNIFEEGDYIFPDTLTLLELKAAFVNEDYDDSHHSHPNIRKRREAILLKMKDKTGGNTFRVSEKEFSKVKKIAQYELCRMYLLEHRFTEALTLALSLQSDNSASTYLKETIAKALYGLARERLDGKLSTDSTLEIGDAGRITHFINYQSSYELSVLAIRELYKCKEKAPDNVEISLMVDDLLEAFGKENSDAAKKFLRSADDPVIQNLAYPYTQYAFVNFKDSKMFFQHFEKTLAAAKKASEKSLPKKSKKSKKKSSKKSKKSKGKKGINKVVVVNPVYKKMDVRKKQKARHIQSEKVLTAIDGKIKEAASELNLKVSIINPNNLTSNQVQIMQHNTILDDWLDEQMTSEQEMISPIYNEIAALADSHKTDHFMWMACFTVNHKIPNKGWAIFSAIIFPPVTPLMALHLARPRGKTVYLALAFDVRQQKLEMLDLRFMTIKDSKQLLKSNIYYSLFKLNN